MAWFEAQYQGSMLGREAIVSTVMPMRPSLMACEAPPEVVVAAGAGASCGGGEDRGIAADSTEDFSVAELLDLEVLDGCAELGVDASPRQLAGAAEQEVKMYSDSHCPAAVVSYESTSQPAKHQMADIEFPAHDAEDLEWVSCVLDDSLAELPPQTKLHAAALVAAARRPLDGAAEAACTVVRRGPPNPVCAVSTESMERVKGKRSKRSRACEWPLFGGAPMSDKARYPYCPSSSASFSPLLHHPAPESSSLFMPSSHYLLQEESTRPAKKNSKHVEHCSKSGCKSKKRSSNPAKHKRKPTQLACGAVAGASPVAHKPGDRRCSHCGVHKTPQWRTGPEGPKTLCNACGVRYMSGRMFPEYRPACSPTFVSTIHSNFHRKVLQMRRQKEGVRAPAPLPPPLAPVPPADVLPLRPAASSF